MKAQARKNGVRSGGGRWSNGYEVAAAGGQGAPGNGMTEKGQGDLRKLQTEAGRGFKQMASSWKDGGGRWFAEHKN